MDALPPPSAPSEGPPAYVYAAAEYRPVGPREEELCAKASHTDYLYWGASFAAVLGAVFVDAHYFKFIGYDPDNAGQKDGPAQSPYGPGVRMFGPALVGLTWGFFVGGGYLAQPKCSPDWVASPPREGDYRSSVPLALALAGLSAVTAPVIEYYMIGGVPPQWPVYERSLRIVVAGASGFVGALLPYVLPPKTWSAAKELERLRVDADTKGASIGYTVRF